MLFQYHVQHQGEPGNKGFAVAADSEAALQFARDRFPGWRTGSSVGCHAVKPYQPKPKTEVGPADLSWVHPMFANV
jgi:hypothetical protein